MEEKRQSARFKKPYTATFFIKDAPQKEFDISGLRDISKGGLRFLAYQKFEIGAVITFHIKFPFAEPPITVVEGQVVDIHAEAGSSVYRTNVKFINLSAIAAANLEQMERINSKKPLY
jgi:hypothetical protein